MYVRDIESSTIKKEEDEMNTRTANEMANNKSIGKKQLTEFTSFGVLVIFDTFIHLSQPKSLHEIKGTGNDNSKDNKYCLLDLQSDYVSILFLKCVE